MTYSFWFSVKTNLMTVAEFPINFTQNPDSTLAFPCEKIKTNFVTYYSSVYFELSTKKKGKKSSILLLLGLHTILFIQDLK